jgi:hypothetical protein
VGGFPRPIDARPANAECLGDATLFPKEQPNVGVTEVTADLTDHVLERPQWHGWAGEVMLGFDIPA